MVVSAGQSSSPQRPATAQQGRRQALHRPFADEHRDRDLEDGLPGREQSPESPIGPVEFHLGAGGFDAFGAQPVQQSGRQLAEVIGTEISDGTRRRCGIVATAAMLVTEAVEFLWVVVGLRLLFRMPLWPSVAIGAVIVGGLLLLGDTRSRPLEIAIFVLLGVVVFGYVTELLLQPPSGEMFGGWVPSPLPLDASPVAVGILGAVVISHNRFCTPAWCCLGATRRTTSAGCCGRVPSRAVSR